MPVGYRTGRKPAIKDVRVPRLSLHSAGLPPPPDFVNRYAAVPMWQMLGNDQFSDCVEAAVLHLIYQQACYANPGAAPIPTDAEAFTFYGKATGFDPNNPATDQGSYVLGPGGVMQYWLTNGVVCGGVLNRPVSFLQITKPSTLEWRQALASFGNVLLGIKLPERIVAADTIPFVWDDPSGPMAGLHEILGVGYQDVAGERLYDIISWGARYRITETCLLALIDEVVTVVDDPSPSLLADMALLRSEA